ETLEFLIGLVHKYLPVLLGIFTLRDANPQSERSLLQARTGRLLQAPRMSAVVKPRRSIRSSRQRLQRAKAD
ncbi:hypothetical protein, partial [Paracoccus pacificus]